MHFRKSEFLRKSAGNDLCSTSDDTFMEDSLVLMVILMLSAVHLCRTYHEIYDSSDKSIKYNASSRHSNHSSDYCFTHTHYIHYSINVLGPEVMVLITRHQKATEEDHHPSLFTGKRPHIRIPCVQNC